MSTITRSHRHEHGFSLIELLTVVAISGTLMAMAVLMTRTTINAAKGDGAMQTVIYAMRTARERAIADRRNIEVRFTNPGMIQTYRREVVGTTETGATTLLDTWVLENGMKFQAPGSIPDTPDAFGKSAAIAFGSALNLIFTAEGTFVDQSGEPLNGTIFLGRPTDPLAARAVTIFGPTALIHGYRWNGRAWQN